jgi:hypothetical protein
MLVVVEQVEAVLQQLPALEALVEAEVVEQLLHFLMVQTEQ